MIKLNEKQSKNYRQGKESLNSNVKQGVVIHWCFPH
jgi:hypothetical protein